MPALRVTTVVEQVASHLRDELFRRKWAGQMPGSCSLAKELGVGHSSIEGALSMLEKEGLLVPQGTGRRRMIVLPENSAAPTLRIAALEYGPHAQYEDYYLKMLHSLAHNGHQPFYTEKTLSDLDMDVKRIARMAKKTKADVWIINSAHRKVLEWFVAEEIPIFSIFGASHGLPIAAIRSDQRVIFTCLQFILALGHRRIVFLVWRGRKRQHPGPLWLDILRELECHGIKTGPYTMPEWEDTPQGFQKMLESLFALTPPTALVIEEPPHFFAALQFCARRGLRVPQDISLICLQSSRDFEFCIPTVAHCRRDFTAIGRLVVRWVNNVALGKPNCRHHIIKAEFVEGGTISTVSR